MPGGSWTSSENDFQTCRGSGCGRRVTFQENIYYDTTDADEIKSRMIGGDMNENTNIASANLGNVRNVPKQGFQGTSHRTRLLGLIEELKLPVDSSLVSEEQGSPRNNSTATLNSSANRMHHSNPFFNRIQSRRTVYNQSRLNTDVQNARFPVQPPLNNHQLFIVNMASRQSRRWGELKLMVDHEPPWKAINIRKDEKSLEQNDYKEGCMRTASFPTGPSQSGFSVSPMNRKMMARLTREIGARNENPIGQVYPSKVFPHSQQQHSSCIVRTPYPNRRAFVAAAEDKWNNNDDQEETCDDDEVGRFVITTERKHLNRLKELLTNPRLLRDTSNAETRKLLANDLKMAEIVELCTRPDKIAASRKDTAHGSYTELECSSSCEVIRGSQMGDLNMNYSPIPDITDFGNGISNSGSNDEELKNKKSKQFSVRKKMSSWGKLKLMKDYIPPWKAVDCALKNENVDQHVMSEANKRVNKIGNTENDVSISLVHLEDDEIKQNQENNPSVEKPSAPKMMIVPSSRRVDHARGHISVDIASFVNTNKYGKIPDFVKKKDRVTYYVPTKTTTTTPKETLPPAKKDINETKSSTEPKSNNQANPAPAEDLNEPVPPMFQYIAMKEEVCRYNEALRGAGILFQRNIATPNQEFWNAPISNSISRKRVVKVNKKSKKFKASLRNMETNRGDWRTMREADIAVAEQMMEQNRRLGFKPGRLTLKELSRRTGLCLSFVRMWEQQQLPLLYYDARMRFPKRWVPPWRESVIRTVSRMSSKVSQQLSRTTMAGKYQNENEKDDYINGNYRNGPIRRQSFYDNDMTDRLKDDSTDFEDLRRCTPSANVSPQESETSGDRSRSRKSHAWRANEFGFGGDDKDVDKYYNKKEKQTSSDRKVRLPENMKSQANIKAFSSRKVARQSRLRERKGHRKNQDKSVQANDTEPIEDWVISKPSEEVFQTVKKKIRGMLNQVLASPNEVLPNGPVEESNCSGNTNFPPRNVVVEDMTDEEFDMTLHGKIREIRRSRSGARDEKKVEKVSTISSAGSFSENSAGPRPPLNIEPDDDEDFWKTESEDEKDNNDDTTAESTSPDSTEASQSQSQYSQSRTSKGDSGQISLKNSTSAKKTSPPTAQPECVSKISKIYSHKMYKIKEHLSKMATKKMLPTVLRGRITSAPPDVNLNFTDSLTDLKQSDGRHHDDYTENLALRGCRSFLF